MKENQSLYADKTEFETLGIIFDKIYILLLINFNYEGFTWVLYPY